MINEIFSYRKVNFNKLIKFGFEKLEDKYVYKTYILNNAFTLFVFVTETGELNTKLIDNETQDEYVLHLNVDCTGEFVGKIRTEFENVLLNIRDNCFEKDVFKSEQAKEIIEYIRTKYNAELEYLWEKFSNNAIWRRKDNSKWFALLVVLSKRKLGLKSDEIVDIIDLRVEPDKLEKLVDNKSIFNAYHMNKKHWITICLNGSVPTNNIFKLIDNSYELAKKG